MVSRSGGCGGGSKIYEGEETNEDTWDESSLGSNGTVMTRMDCNHCILDLCFCHIPRDVVFGNENANLFHYNHFAIYTYLIMS